MMSEAVSATHAADHVERLRQRVNDELACLASAEEPADLYEPVRHVLAGEGKRVRPILVLLAAEAFEVETERALPAALAVEVFHNFTLVHDDIMDHADSRRGQPTVHRKWNASTAILSGDYLMSLAYELLARTRVHNLNALLETFSRMVTRLCEGQSLDKAFETRRHVSVDDYLRMIDRKTAALIQASLELGGQIGEASSETREVLRRTGRHIGRAFQIQDDLLDLVADNDRWGKQIGGDLIEGKKTFLLLRALERAEGEEFTWFFRIIESGGLPEENVDEARDRMERLGILQEARSAVAHHSAAAKDELDLIPSGPPAGALYWLIGQMEARMH